MIFADRVFVFVNPKVCRWHTHHLQVAHTSRVHDAGAWRYLTAPHRTSLHIASPHHTTPPLSSPYVTTLPLTTQLPLECTLQDYLKTVPIGQAVGWSRYPIEYGYFPCKVRTSPQISLHHAPLSPSHESW